MELEKDLKVLMISARSDTGGGPQHLYDLVLSLKQISPNTKIVISAPLEGKYGQVFQEIADDFIPIPHRSFSILGFYKILSYYKEHSFNLVHSHGRGAGLYSRLLSFFGIKVIHTFHGVHLAPGFVGKIKLMLDYFLKYLSDKNICVSQSEMNRAIERNVTIASQTIIIPNGIDKSLICHSLNKKNNSSYQIGCLARLSYPKGIDLLISHISKFRRNHPQKEFKVFIAGPGNQKEFQKLILSHDLKNHVSLVGETQDSLSFLDSLDCYISFSRWEGLPLSVLEAMARGIPCLLSDVPGHSDFQTALKFPLEDNSLFNKKLLQLMTDEKLRAEMIHESQNLIENVHSSHVMAKKTLKVYLKEA